VVTRDVAAASIIGAPSPRRALTLLWVGLWSLLATTLVGLAWDRAWHATHVFDTFYSPPHLFIYISTMATTCLVAYMWFDADVHAEVGSGPLMLLGGGFATLALAGVLDDVWHSSFGLDETGWSFPHAMLGKGWLLVCLGFISARLALAERSPVSWYARAFLGWLALAFSLTPFLGPLHTNRTPETVAAVARIPALAAQPAFQHTFRIYEAWGLDRTSPLLVLFGALWAGAAVAFLCRLERRTWLVLLVLGAWTVFQFVEGRGYVRRFEPFDAVVGGQPAAWLPLPVLPAALVYLGARRVRLAEVAAWLLAGLVFGSSVLRFWTAPTALGPALVLLAVPLCLTGAWLGTRTARIVERPSRSALVYLVVLVGLAWPFVGGLADLYLRWSTP